ncbi:MAG: hypothetical protein ABL958_14645, partial [Bdellovibrionia bacterium]
MLFSFNAGAATKAPSAVAPRLGKDAFKAESSQTIRAFDPSKIQARRPKRKSLKERSAADLCPLDIVPGRSFGPLKLGMNRDELEKLHLPARLTNEGEGYVSSNEDQLERGSVGPFYVVLTNNKLTRIRGDLDLLP